MIVNNLSGKQALAPVQVGFATFIAGKLPPPVPLTDLQLLPREGLVPGSARLVRGAYGLQAVYTLGDGDILMLERKLTAASGDYKSAKGSYTLVVASYQDAAQAKRAFDHLRKNLDSYLKVVDQKPDRFVFQDYAKKFGVASVVGSRLEIRVKLPQKP